MPQISLPSFKNFMASSGSDPSSISSGSVSKSLGMKVGSKPKEELTTLKTPNTSKRSQEEVPGVHTVHPVARQHMPDPTASQGVEAIKDEPNWSGRSRTLNPREFRNLKVQHGWVGAGPWHISNTDNIVQFNPQQMSYTVSKAKK